MKSPHVRSPEIEGTVPAAAGLCAGDQPHRLGDAGAAKGAHEGADRGQLLGSCTEGVREAADAGAHTPAGSRWCAARHLAAIAGQHACLSNTMHRISA